MCDVLDQQGMVLFLAASLALIAALPPILAQMGIGHWVETAFRILRWPLLAVFVMLMLAVFYRYAPDRHNAHNWWLATGFALKFVRTRLTIETCSIFYL